MRTPPRFFLKKFLENSACYYYRCEQVARGLNELGVDITTGGEWECEDERDQERYLMHLGQQDFVYYYASGGDSTKRLVKFLNKIPAVNGEVGPCYLADLDDNCDFVNPVNHRFGKLGTRMPNGRLLKPGEAVRIGLPDGEFVELWKDGKNGVDWKANQDSLRAMNWTFKNAAGVSFTTDRLTDYYRKRYHLQNAYTRPNAIFFEDFPNIKLRKDPSRVRLFWQGGDAHYPDFYPMKQALEAAIARHPNLDLVVWGPLYPWVYENIPRDRIEHHEWVPYDAYKIKLAALDFDILFAPLVNNKFNIYKSCIKHYEASALAEPKPVLAARTPPYSDELLDGKTAYLFAMPTEQDPTGQEFQHKLDLLIQKVELRHTLAGNAADWVRQHREAKSVIANYWEWLQRTRANYEQEKIEHAAISKAYRNL